MTCLSTCDELRAEVAGVVADVALLAHRLRRVRELHCDFGIYGDCGHGHADTDDDVIDIDDVGLTCEQGRLYSICRTCCVDADGDQTEECAATHDHQRSVCGTRDALLERQEESANA